MDISQAGQVFSHFHQCFQSAQTLESNSLAGCISAIFISGSDMLKHWRATHKLDVHLAIVSGSDLLKH